VRGDETVSGDGAVALKLLKPELGAVLGVGGKR